MELLIIDKIVFKLLEEMGENGRKKSDGEGIWGRSGRSWIWPEWGQNSHLDIACRYVPRYRTPVVLNSTRERVMLLQKSVATLQSRLEWLSAGGVLLQLLSH